MHVAVNYRRVISHDAKLKGCIMMRKGEGEEVGWLEEERFKG
jgi:hypothetical protein